MKKNLYKIHGDQIQELPFQLEWVGDLIYYDWALLSVFVSKESKEPIIQAWVDSSQLHDRYLIFQTSKRILEGYMLEQLPYFEMLRNVVNGTYYAVDINKQTGEEEVFTKVEFKGLNDSYLPDKEVRFRSYDDYSTINNFFSLETNLEKYLYGERDIISRAKHDDSEIVNMHFTSTNGLVGHGEIQSNILAEALLAYNKMAEAIVLKLYDERNVNRTRVLKWEPGERENIVQLSRTTLYAETGSFDVILTPVKVKQEQNGKSSTENIVERIFSLFRMGQELNFSNTPRSAFPQEMFSAYETFLGVIQRNGIHVSMQYGNPYKGYKLQEYFDPIKASYIIKKLKSIEADKPVERKLTGKFTGFYNQKQLFEFITLTGNKIEGTFNTKTEEQISPIINFKDTFNIVISTSYQTKSNRDNIIEKNELIECYRTKV